MTTIHMFHFWVMTLLWDVSELFSIRTGWSCLLGHPAPFAKAGDVTLPALLVSMTFDQVQGPESSFFGDWPPRWYLDAVNQGRAMQRDGGRGADILLSLLAAISSRGTPAYTAYTYNIVRDLAQELGVQVPDDPLPSTTSNQAVVHLGSMSQARLNDWVTYVERSILLEYLHAHFPQLVHEWNMQVGAGVHPRSPVTPWRDVPGLATFNHLIAQEPVPLPDAPTHFRPEQTWAIQVVRDIQNFHAEGFMVGGLVSAIGVYVDGRRYDEACGWAYEQMHTVRSFTRDLHNLTTAVPPANFNNWADMRERELWEQARARSASWAARPAAVAPLLCLYLFRSPWTCVMTMAVAMAQPGGGGPEAVEGQGPTFPAWLVTSARTARALHNAGVAGSDLLGLLMAVVEARGDERYTNFAHTVVDLLGALSGLTRGEAHPGVVQQQTAEWVDFAERHLLTEYLVVYHGNEVVLHDAAMNAGLPAEAALPALHEEDDHLRARRERYNRLRQTPPLLQRLRAQPLPPADPRGHRLAWTGAVVGQVHDYYVEGYHTVAAEPLLQACVADRHFAEYERGARAYIREASNQLGSFAGPVHTNPENLAAWARQMEQELWEAFVLHGLDLQGDVYWSDSSSSGSITGDESNLMQRPKDKWLKKGDEGRRRRRSRSTGRPRTRTTRGDEAREPEHCTRCWLWAFAALTRRWEPPSSRHTPCPTWQPPTRTTALQTARCSCWRSTG